MTSPQPNPRRCYKTKALPPSASHQPASTRHVRHPSSAAETNLSLRKSATFHSPKSPASDDDPILNIPLLCRRSPTSPKDLEDAVSANESRIIKLLGSVDRSLSGLQSFSSESQDTLHAEDSPVPRFMLDGHAAEPDHMDVDSPTSPTKTQQPRRHHTSDSGIGSTVTSSEESLFRDEAGTRYQPPSHALVATAVTHTQVTDKLDNYKNSIPALINEIQSGINGTTAPAVGQTGARHALSAYACRQIQKYIIIPILREKTLKDFHPLVTGIPLRVGRKEITCLRDLEKVLLWLAPVSESRHVGVWSLTHGVRFQRFSVSRSSFLKFSETSIRCLHTTVEHLNETDQRRPTDRPYTNGYFLDLTEQIRQYAAMITASRERMAAGQAREGDHTPYACDAHEYDPLTLTVTRDERLSLQGGISQTGRPAELVRSKDGQSYSLRTGEEIKEAEKADVKLSTSQEEQDEFFLSMARRRKSAQAATKEVQRCSECDKEFKRPCDLTKHEKTHSRPWKCGESNCKYSQYGWPTEKERDRHVNDKHSVTPSMYKCQYHPCPYESKRESNCKQHMEKAHGWAYVRSKNNGKTGRRSKPSSKTPPTPQMTTPGSHIFDASGSDFGSSPSPYMMNGSIATSTATGSIGSSPFLDMNDSYNSFDPAFAWDQNPTRLTPPSSFTPASHRLSLDSGTLDSAPTVPSSSYGTSMQDIEHPLFNGTFDWSNMDLESDLTNMNIQLFTPATSIDGAYPHKPSISLDHQPIKSNPNLSPGAEGGVMLYSPYAADAADEGYEDFTTTDMGKPNTDFALFDSRPTSRLSDQAAMPLFSDLPPFQPTNWSTQEQQFCVDDLMEQ